jgi:beta-lactam-binding protein with PASTA domain
MRQIFRALFAVLALLAIALVSALITMRLAIHGAEVRVPTLSGMTVADAAEKLHASGLETGVDGHFYSTTQSAGNVLTQSPMAGTLVRKSWRVRITVSLGAQKTAIPALEGMNVSIAGITIRRSGLQLGDTVAIPYGYAPEGAVVAQTPMARATDVAGPKVGLLTALAVVPKEDASVMPDLTGEPFTSATLAILHAGFTLAPLHSVPAVLPTGAAVSSASPSAPSGTVTAQSPVAGSRIVAGSMIHLTVQP